MELRQAVILCGGLGSRLRKVLAGTPKFLAPVGGVPFCSHLFCLLEHIGIRSCILATGIGSDAIVDYLASSYLGPLRFRVSREESPLGTGGAVKKALAHVEYERVMLVNGDTILVGRDMSSAVQRLSSSGAPVGVLGVEVAECARFGRLRLDRRGRVREFSEKGAAGPGMINSGYYVLHSSRLAMLLSSMHPPFSWETFLQRGIASGRLEVTMEPVAGCFLDIGVEEDYRRGQLLIPRWLEEFKRDGEHLDNRP